MLLTQFLQGSLTLLQKPFFFVGYLAVGPQPVLYVLYCSATRLEALKAHVKVIVFVLPINPHSSLWAQSMEVPIFSKKFFLPNNPPMNLDLTALWSKPCTDGTLIHVYAWLSHLKTLKPLSGNEHNTVIVEALFLFGHYHEAYPVFSSDGLTEISGFLESHHESPVASNSSRAPSVVPESSAVLSVAAESARPSSITCSHDDTPLNNLNNLNDQNDLNAQADSNSLHNIQSRHLQWQTILVRVRILMRVALSRGEYSNPFVLTQAACADQKARFVADLFDRSLNKLGLTRSKLTTACLRLVNDTLFVVCLDDAAPGCNGVSALILNGKKGEDLAALCSNFLCRTYDLQEGVQVGMCTNQWYDKASQVDGQQQFANML
ncbi:hypothetical protein BDR05DRAFT_948950 [Suillus weaverae]|nr:hypothetical protein BDR05DRAFT_948950 [Suillus weaverae]